MIKKIKQHFCDHTFTEVGHTHCFNSCLFHVRCTKCDKKDGMFTGKFLSSNVKRVENSHKLKRDRNGYYIKDNYGTGS